MTAPNVCIIIAAYNAQDTIARAIRSALTEQEVAEVIVVDDASTDGTVNTARSVEDGSGRLKIIIQSKNAGPSAARNRAIAESTSPWIGVLDADDFFLPGRTKALLAFSEQNDFIADDMYQVNEQAIDGPRKSLMGEAFTEQHHIDFENFVLSNVTRPNRDRGEMGFLKPLIRRQFLTDHAINYREHLRLGEDYELYARALGLGARFILIPTKRYVSVMRVHSLSGQHSEADLFNLRECDKTLLSELKLTYAEKNALRQHYLSIDCRLQWRRLISAVKNKDIKAAITTFFRPYPVPFYLLKQLWIHACQRSCKKVS